MDARTVTGHLALGASIVLAALCLGLPSHARAEGPAPVFSRAPLFIDTARGVTHRFDVEVATTDAQRSYGLMFRTELAPDAGMLFVWESEGVVGMWMKNTFIPLDMLFIAGDGRIAHIAANTIPKSLRIVSSRAPVRGALELPGGSAARLGIAPGDRVRSEALPAAP